MRGEGTSVIRTALRHGSARRTSKTGSGRLFGSDQTKEDPLSRTSRKNNAIKVYDPEGRAAQVEQATAELAEETRRAQGLAEAVDAAREAADELRAELHSGNTEIDALQLIAADAEITRAQLLAEGADKRVQRRTAGLPFFAVLAETISEAVEDVLGVPVQIVDEAPTEAPDGLPVAFLVQPAAGKHDIHKGHLSGRAQLVYIRSDLHIGLDGDRVENALRERHIGLSVTDRGTRELAPRVKAQTLRLDIATAWPKVPVIASKAQPPAMYTSPIGTWIARAIVDDSWMGGTKEQVTITADGETVGNFSFFTDGIRTTTIEVKVSARSVGQFWKPGELAERIGAGTKSYEGRVLTGVGRVTSAEVVDNGLIGAHAVRARIRLVAVSRTS
jgi:hypothetical protein